MITEQQLCNIHKLHISDISKILDECIEALGVVDIKTAERALSVNRSRVYQLMNNTNTKRIGIHKFLMINVLIHQGYGQKR